MLLGLVLALVVSLLPVGVGPAAAAAAPSALPNYSYDVRYGLPLTKTIAPVTDIALKYEVERGPAKGTLLAADTVPHAGGYNEFAWTDKPNAGARGADDFSVKATAAGVELRFRVVLTLAGPVTVGSPAFTADADGKLPVTRLTAGQRVYLSFPQRRMTDFMPLYPNGVIPIVPGDTADNPVLGDTRIWTDGEFYYSASDRNRTTTQRWTSEEFAPTLTGILNESRAALPVHVGSPDNGVAWTATKLVSDAAGAPEVIRLMLIDRGYVNPDDHSATVTLNLPGRTIKGATDIINPDKPVLNDGNKSVDDHIDASGTVLANLTVPAGAWRIIDVIVGP